MALPAAVGSIPASAGNPCRARCRRSSGRVHPRERGESVRILRRAGDIRGPSPRARGILALEPAFLDDLRSIPASAGNPSIRLVTWPTVRVHPRERGESFETMSPGVSGGGPSPRARGIRRRRRFEDGRPGSIPASAGNPPPARCRCCSATVHPRERGESEEGRAFAMQAAGPSPRARGIPRPRHRPRLADGSIPASAGNPRRSASTRSGPRVHPRERGESPSTAATPTRCTGPSPRARGIRGGAPVRDPGRGSIPASAGNPAAHAAGHLVDQVHPRERGESVAALAPGGRVTGPSPRARGIRRGPPLRWRELGSIPASAGNPSAGSTARTRATVHPRERGESVTSAPATNAVQGPSPRARGILV